MIRKVKKWWSIFNQYQQNEQLPLTSTHWTTTTSHLNSLKNYLSPQLIEQQLPLTSTHWTTTTSHLKSLNNNYLSPQLIEQQLPLTSTHWTTTTSHLNSLNNNNYLSPQLIEQQLPHTSNCWTLTKTATYADCHPKSGLEHAQQSGGHKMWSQLSLTDNWIVWSLTAIQV